jgi:hypothetical protein
MRNTRMVPGQVYLAPQKAVIDKCLAMVEWWLDGETWQEIQRKACSSDIWSTANYMNSTGVDHSAPQSEVSA